MEENEEAMYTINLPENEIKDIPGTFSKRALAFIIDLIFFYFILFQPYYLVFSYYANIPLDLDLESLMNNSDLANTLNIIATTGAFILFFYFVMFEKNLGWSIGKKLLSLKVTDLKGKEITYFQAIIRNLTKCFFPLAFLIDILPMFFNPLKQRLTEEIIKTKVKYHKSLKLVQEGI